jgi:transposase-like protein
VLPEVAWQRCYVHFLRNALDYVPRKVDDDCLMELRWLYDRRDLELVCMTCVNQRCLAFIAVPRWTGNLFSLEFFRRR